MATTDTLPDNKHATTFFELVSSHDGNAVIRVKTVLEDGVTSASSDFNLPLVDYTAFRQTSADTARAIIGHGKAHPDNMEAQNAYTATLLVLLEMKQNGLNPLQFINGMPSFNILVQTAEKHIELPHIPLSQAMLRDISSYVSATKEKFAKPEAALAV